MAPSFSKFAPKSGKTLGRIIVPPIGLKRPGIKEPVKGEYAIMKCRTNPTDATSPMFDLPVPYFNTGQPEEWLKFVINLER